MSNLDRVGMLRAYILDEPENPFNRYALALEIKEIDPNEAAELFDFLLLNHSRYLPVYFPSAHFFFEIGQLEKAQGIFQNGIALAQELNNQKTLKELQNAYQNFLFDSDLN